MGHDRKEWLRAAVRISSYRGMHAFAGHIIQSAGATARDRRAAERVHNLLDSVIHLPIADATLLLKARQRFTKLVASLRAGIDEATIAALCGPLD